MQRILALDYGKRRIGLAVCDPSGVAVRGLETFQRKRVRGDLEALAALAHGLEAEMLLFGEPRNLDGSQGEAAAGVRQFASRLSQASGLPVCFWDERLTTVEAEEVLTRRGLKFEERRKAVDQMAAVILLHDYLEAQTA